ncbi:signal recognition particle, SRP14 subunit, partial [Tricladium varicosporioides]
AQFFEKLSELFTATSGHGSIYLTQKRSVSIVPNQEVYAVGDTKIEDPGSSQPFADSDPSKSFPIIIRATNGKSKEKREKKIKLSTIVEAGALEGFYAKYADVCKSKMSALKKRDRSKAKERLKAKK